jgi:predicted O-methyltransferase YrrM
MERTRERKRMGNRPAGYWILLLLAVVAVVVAFMTRSSPDAHTREIGKYLGYGAIALLLIARLFFGPKRQPTPPMPKD